VWRPTASYSRVLPAALVLAQRALAAADNAARAAALTRFLRLRTGLEAALPAFLARYAAQRALIPAMIAARPARLIRRLRRTGAAA
jgi:hypothetical protein